MEPLRILVNGPLSRDEETMKVFSCIQNGIWNTTNLSVALPDSVINRIDFTISSANNAKIVRMSLLVELGDPPVSLVVREANRVAENLAKEAGKWTETGELTNKTVIINQKKRLNEAKGKCREILLEVLWAYRTTSKSNTGATPFSLVYGIETLILVEVEEPGFMFWNATEESNYEALNISLELLYERWEAALVRMAAPKQRIERYYSRRANLPHFKTGDLLLRKVTLNTRDPNEGKLGLN
ncbi:PREDICTED: uncharacterized protein LOC109243381 [Nicotiana attenuata]|uniref:uncharacterized protein LOC109243381 n=1 Tax=Nicotiana attenuata TaxID=49451 RepID=UPI000904928D|nr:PREDICTED: uncharacterized protein LOC109243381 [Nicotiana attenuata]